MWERDVADVIERRAAEELAATPLIGSKKLGWHSTLAVFGVALALASIPPVHRRVHGGAQQLATASIPC